MPVNYVAASGKDVADLVDLIEDVVQGYPTITVAIASIVVAALAQNPDVTPERLQNVVQSVSELMATRLFEPPTGEAN